MPLMPEAAAPPQRVVEVDGVPVSYRAWGAGTARRCSTCTASAWPARACTRTRSPRCSRRAATASSRPTSRGSAGRRRWPRSATCWTRSPASTWACFDASAIERAALLGFSWGGSLSVHVAARAPERIAALVLLDAGHVDAGCRRLAVREPLEGWWRRPARHRPGLHLRQRGGGRRGAARRGAALVGRRRGVVRATPSSSATGRSCRRSPPRHTRPPTVAPSSAHRAAPGRRSGRPASPVLLLLACLPAERLPVQRAAAAALAEQVPQARLRWMQGHAHNLVAEIGHRLGTSSPTGSPRSAGGDARRAPAGRGAWRPRPAGLPRRRRAAVRDAPADCELPRPRASQRGRRPGGSATRRLGSIADQPRRRGWWVVPRRRGPHRWTGWAHGTTGVVSRCAPSSQPDPLTAEGMPDIGRVMQRGWAIVATDYVGLGASPPHPYLVGGPEARSVLDAVLRRAQPARDPARAEDRRLGPLPGRGGAALWTGILAPTYAPDAHVLGVAALAPAADLPALFGGGPGTGQAGTIFGSYLLSGYAAAYPDVRLNDYVDPRARPLVRRITGLCLGGTDGTAAVADAIGCRAGLLAEPGVRAARAAPAAERSRPAGQGPAPHRPAGPGRSARCSRRSRRASSTG